MPSMIYSTALFAMANLDGQSKEEVDTLILCTLPTALILKSTEQEYVLASAEIACLELKMEPISVTSA